MDTRTSRLEPPLYGRLGEHTVSTIVEHFYERVLADPDLEHYFALVPMNHVRAMQEEIFLVALGAPGLHSNIDIHDAHAPLAITPKHFSRFVEHLSATLDRMHVDDEVIDALLARLALHADDVIGSGEGVDG